MIECKGLTVKTYYHLIKTVYKQLFVGQSTLLTVGDTVA